MNIFYRIFVFVIMTGVILAAFLVDIPYMPALKDTARVLYFHVPMSWIGFVAFLMAMVYSIKYLRTKNIDNDIKASAAAQMGFIFCILATLTGAVWAKFTWGSFWNWDPRQTSIFILLLIYGAYFALRSSIDTPERKARLSSVYAIIAFVTVPFFMFIMPRIVESLHPDPIINTQGKVNMDPAMLSVFLTSIFAFMLLFFWMFNIKVRAERIYLAKFNKEVSA